MGDNKGGLPTCRVVAEIENAAIQKNRTWIHKIKSHHRYEDVMSECRQFIQLYF